MGEGKVTGIIMVSGVLTHWEQAAGVTREMVLERMASRVAIALVPVLSDPRPRQIMFEGLEEKTALAFESLEPGQAQQDVEFSMQLLVVLKQLEDAEVGDLVSLDIYDIEPGLLPITEGGVSRRFEKTGHGWLRVE